MADEGDHDGRMMLQVIGVAVTAIATIGTIWTMRRRRGAAAASGTADKSKSGAATRTRGSSGQGTVLASRIKANGGQWPPKRSRSRNSSTSGFPVDKVKASATKKNSPRRNTGRSVKSIAGAYDKKQEDANLSPSTQRKSITLKATRVASHKRKISGQRSPRYNSATLPPNAKTSSTTAPPVAVRKAKLPTVKRSSVRQSSKVRPVVNGTRVSPTSTTTTTAVGTSRSSAVTSTTRKAKVSSLMRPTASSSSKVRPVSEATSSSSSTRTTTSRPRPSITRKAKVPPKSSPTSANNSSSTLRKTRTVVAPSTRTVKPSSPDSRTSSKSKSPSSSSSSKPTSSRNGSSAISKLPQKFKRDAPSKTKALQNGVKSNSHSDSKASINSSNSDAVKATDPPVKTKNTFTSSSAGSAYRPTLKRAQTSSIRCHLCLARIVDVTDKTESCSFEGKFFHADCFECQHCGISLSEDSCELFELIGPLCLDHAKALKNSKKKLRNAARAIGAFKLSGAISVSPSDAVAASSSKPKPTPLVIKDDDAVEEYSIATADAGGDANAEEDLDSLFDDIMATHIEENEESDSHTSSKPTPTLPVVKQNAVEEYSIAAGDADAEDDFNSLFDDIMATHIEENDESDSQDSALPTSELQFTPRRRRQITEESEKFFSEEMFCKTSPRTKDSSPKLRCFRCSDHRKERVSVDTSRRLISLGYPSKVGFCSHSECFACLKCSTSLHTVLEQRGMKAISVSPFGAVCTSCVTFNLEAGE